MAHFVELPDETLDWKSYYSVGLPKDLSDEKWRTEIGHRGWYLIHGAIDNYPCSLCRESGSKLIRGVHDVVNVFTGKAPRYPKDLAFLAEESTKAANLATVKQLNFSAPKVRHMAHETAPMVVRHG